MTEAEQADLDRIVDSARRLGMELDEHDAAAWLEAIDLAAGERDIVVSPTAGVFGHRVTMLDFSDDDLAYHRAIGELVRIPDSDDVETALALSGSAAQSKIQAFPGDCDYFQRINIHAATREDACRRLAEILQDKARKVVSGPTYRLVEGKFGTYPMPVLRSGRELKPGTPISWTPAEIDAGFIQVEAEDGLVEVGWSEVAVDPGWTKFDWVVADPVRRSVANASNMFDVTWESPDGLIVPLDGYLDPYFQEVYLDAAKVPLFAKLASNVAADALDTYVGQLEKEAAKYLCQPDLNYGKAAKRMYNVFRLNGRYSEAAFLREIFDEPATVLYQVYSVLRTLEEAADPSSRITPATVVDQLDRLLLDVVASVDGADEQEIVADLLRLRDLLQDQSDLTERSETFDELRQHVLGLVNEFFRRNMESMPEVAEYMVACAAG